MVEFNIRKLHDYDLICARERKEKRRGALNVWPELLYDKTLDFLNAARDEAVWNEALKSVLLAGASGAYRGGRAVNLTAEDFKDAEARIAAIHFNGQVDGSGA